MRCVFVLFCQYFFYVVYVDQISQLLYVLLRSTCTYMYVYTSTIAIYRGGVSYIYKEDFLYRN